MYCVGDIDGCIRYIVIFFKIKSFVRYKENVLFKPNVFVCAKVFICYNAGKPCEICATKAKYLNQCITPGKNATPIGPYNSEIQRSNLSVRFRHRASLPLIYFFPLHGIVVLNN